MRRRHIEKSTRQWVLRGVNALVKMSTWKFLTHSNQHFTDIFCVCSISILHAPNTVPTIRSSSVLISRNVIIQQTKWYQWQRDKIWGYTTLQRWQESFVGNHTDNTWEEYQGRLTNDSLFSSSTLPCQIGYRWSHSKTFTTCATYVLQHANSVIMNLLTLAANILLSDSESVLSQSWVVTSLNPTIKERRIRSAVALSEIVLLACRCLNLKQPNDFSLKLSFSASDGFIS